jgi:hypothetical protein
VELKQRKGGQGRAAQQESIIDAGPTFRMRLCRLDYAGCDYSRQGYMERTMCIRHNGERFQM